MSTTELLCRKFSLDEIKQATRNFDDELIIGKGGFGLVYLGSINDNANVAIKRLSCESTQGETEFLREIQTLSKLRHHNLVRLEGYCNESQEKILVYEYMQNGTLADHLYKGFADHIGDNQPSRLTWEQRLNICIGAARGLDFLHRGAVPGVIHRDVKGSNILLDGYFMAKIADFGLAKLVKTTIDPRITTVSTTIFKGTFGYMDPEYFYTQRLTTKTDVYAFGVVLLVVLSGRPAVDNKAEEDQRGLAEWSSRCIAKNRIDLIMDPYMVGKISSRSLKQFVKISQKCLYRQSEKRPTMEEVVAGLQLALKKQQTSGTSSRQLNASSSLTQMVLAKLQITMKKNPQDQDNWILSAALAGCPRFSLAEIKIATQDFSNMIGWDEFGKVYLGRINNGAEIVAIRNFSLESEFLREIKTLCKVQHDNIIRLKGYCYESSQKVIVYEYMPKGSLENSLIKCGQDRHCFSWEQRLNICLCVARGLEFLHRVIEPGIVHRNVTCSKIMLDDNFVPKITDFSLAKLASSEYDTYTHTAIHGTIDYIAPEYRRTRRVTTKIDVYSFGVVLLVVLCGRKVIEYPAYIRTNFVSDAGRCIQGNRIDDLIDPDLRGQFKSESLSKFLEVAQYCLHQEPEERHTMKDVVAGLEVALEKQLDSTSSEWVESHGLPNLLCLLQPQIDIMLDQAYSNVAEWEPSDEGEYSSELYGELLEEYSDVWSSGSL